MNKLPKLELSGCNSKLRASDLLSLLDARSFGKLAPDAQPFLENPLSYMTIDTILPVTRSPKSYSRIALSHALNDLYARAARPKEISVAYSLDRSSITSGSAREIVLSMEEAVVEVGAHLCNAHTSVSECPSITVAAVGVRNAQSPIQVGQRYSIVLTKPLGASLAYHIGELKDNKQLIKVGEGSMTLGHGRVLEVLQNSCEGTTDISGFGFLGHMTCLTIQQQCSVVLRLESLPIIEGLENEISSLRLAGCSSVRNAQDFDEYCDWQEADDFKKHVLYSGETSGPLACIVPEASTNAFISDLRTHGFLEAQEVGELVKAQSPKLLIK